MCPTQSWVDNIEKDLKGESWIEKRIENGENRNIGDNEAKENWMNNIEDDEKEKSSSENVAKDMDDPNLSDCKNEDEADVMNHKKAFHEETLDNNSELGSSRRTTVVEGEDGLAPAYREVIRELEEHRQHFKVDFYQISSRELGRFLTKLISK